MQIKKKKIAKPKPKVDAPQVIVKSDPSTDMLLLSHEQHRKDQSAHNDRSLEMGSRQLDELKKISPQTVIIELDNGDDIETLEIEGPQGPEGPEGKPGKDGKDADEAAIIAKVIAAVLAKIPKPKDGMTPVKGKDYLNEADIAEILKHIRPFLPKAIPGKPGRDGEDATVDYDKLAKLVAKSMPATKHGKDGSPDTAEDIIKKIKGKLEYSDLKGLPLRPVNRGGGAGYVYELSDVDTKGLQAGQVLIWNGKAWKPGTPSTATSINFADAEVPARTNATTYTLAHAPNPAASLILIRGGAIQKQGDDYTLSSNTITFSASVDTREILEAYYRY